MESLTYGQLIRGNRNFRNLLTGQFISELGNWFNFIAGLGIVRQVSGASPMAAGLFFVSRLIPFALISPIAGTFVDRFSRRTVMIVADLARVFVALAFLLVNDPGDLWIAYVATVLLSAFGAFFEGAKNAAAPNVTGKEGLLAGTALLFSTRFLLMAGGSALGGAAAAVFGYQVAFIINAASFAVSAYTVWLIPEEAVSEGQNHLRERVVSLAMKGSTTPSAEAAATPPIQGGELGKSQNHLRERVVSLAMEGSTTPSAEAAATPPIQGGEPKGRESFWVELKEGFRYALGNHFALTILLMNIMWAIGGGSINIIYERLGGVHFAALEGWNPDAAVAILWTATGLGLGLGMLIAHRTSAYLDRRKRHRSFIGWTLIVHGVVFAIGGFMPTLWLLAVVVFVSRLIVGVEYAVQETMFQRSLPDHIRGRISTLDRGAEITVFGLMSYTAGASMYYITPQTLTLISGILSAFAGVVWFIRQRNAGEEEAKM